MLQPFEFFSLLYLNRVKQLNKRFLVTQTYSRGLHATTQCHKINLLVSDYSDPGLAAIHYNAVRHDKYAAIIDLENEKHYIKILSLLQNDSGYCLYWAVVASVKKLESVFNKIYKERLRKYIDKNTNWSIGRDKTLKPKLQLTFGELFIFLKHGSQTLRIKFEEIEIL